ncbi:OsmC family protein [Microbacterium sp. A93]|uniref:OsmC family protein n=1 Tax=Microbacterium sp. A93 TaxID=3450716 RepID=UPI003F438705
MSMRYRTEAINRDGGDGIAQVPDGLSVKVASPLNPHRDADGTNPEQLLALAWATCLNATAQVIVARGTRSAVRVEVELHDADPGPGLEFHVDGYLSVEGASVSEAEDVLAAAHARCPVSKLLAGSADVRVHTEAYSVS